MNQLKQAQQITDLLSNWVRALRAKDIAAITSIYHNDIIAFDAIGQLQFKGLADYRAHWQRCMAFCSGESFFEMHQLQVRGFHDICHHDPVSHCVYCATGR